MAHPILLETLTVYLAAYGVFRFAVEFVRGNEVVWAGLTRPQIFLLLTVPLLLTRVGWLLRNHVVEKVSTWPGTTSTPSPR